MSTDTAFIFPSQSMKCMFLFYFQIYIRGHRTIGKVNVKCSYDIDEKRIKDSSDASQNSKR